MTKFKIQLLTPIISEYSTDTQFLSTAISDFDSSNLENSWTFTEEEKISFHLNAQKTFSFQMQQFAFINDQEQENPFIKQLSIGSQILVTDMYDNEYFFTVSGIDFVFKNNNTVISYTCQDSFTYQLIRQKSNYSIDNDSNSSDFIGAQTLDWWVTEKVQPECGIFYEYIPLSWGVYLDSNNNLQKYHKKSDLLEKTVNKIIKEPFDTTVDKEIFEAFPFSVSGSNAESCLIELGNILGVQLVTKEHSIKENNRKTNFYKQYFWFEPAKNSNRISSIQYSPKQNIKDFGLSYKGDSLTSVLNVDPITLPSDEVLNIIPEVPLFFSNLIQNKTEWEKSVFYTGFFSQICREQVLLASEGYGEFTYAKNIFTTPQENGSFYNQQTKDLYLYLPSINIPLFYDYVSFKGSSFQVFGLEDVITPFTRKWKLAQITHIEDYTIEEKTWDINEEIDSELLGATLQNIFIKITLDIDEIPLITNDNIQITFYRNPSEEEVEFARLADQCPWLENKLIDFSYYLNKNIITKKEYNLLMKEFVDELRKINGQLLLYAKSYYNALRLKTTKLAEVQEKIDLLSASFHSDVVSSFTQFGSVKDISNFQSHYLSFKTYCNSGDAIDLLDRGALLEEYANKYINAQQRFLKNIYEFKKYFNSPMNQEEMILYRDSIHFDSFQTPTQPGIYRYLSFSPSGWELIDSSFTQYIAETGEPTVEIWNKDWKTKPIIVTKNNYRDFYIPSIKKDDLLKCDKNSVYQSGVQYYRQTFWYDASDNLTSYKRLYMNTNQETKTTDKYIAHNGAEVVSGKSIFVAEYKVTPNAWYYCAEAGNEQYPGCYFITNSGKIVIPEVVDNHFKAPEDATLLHVQSENEDAKAYCMAYYWKREGDRDYYCSVGHDMRLNMIESRIEYLPCIKSDIYNYFLFKKSLYNKLSWCYHNSDTYTNIDWWGQDSFIGQGYGNFLPKAWMSTIHGEEYEDEEVKIEDFEKFYSALESLIPWLDDTKERIYWALYRKYFPIQNLQFVGGSFVNKPIYINGKKLNYQKRNNKGQTLQQYIEYWKKTKSGSSDSDQVNEVINPYDSSQVKKYSIPIVNHANAFSYYRRVVESPFWGYAASVGGILLGGCFAGGVLKNIISNRVWSAADTIWATEGKNTRYANDTLIGEETDKPKGVFYDGVKWNYTPRETSYDDAKTVWEGMTVDGEDGNRYIIYGLSETKPRGKYLTLATAGGSTLYAYLWQYNFPSDLNFSRFTQYCDFYTNFAPSYSTVLGLKNIYKDEPKNSFDGLMQYKNGWLRPIKLDSKINKYNKYKIFIQEFVESNNKVKNKLFANDSSVVGYQVLDSIFSQNNSADPYNRISKVLHYLIYNSAVDLDLSVLNWKNQTTTLEEVLESAGWFNIRALQDTSYVIEATGEKTIRFIVCEEEDFVREFIYSTYKTDPNTMYHGTSLFNDLEATKISLQNESGLLDDMFYFAAEDGAFIKTSDGDFTSTQRYYTEDGERAYSINEIINAEDFYYSTSTTYSLESLSSTETIFVAPVYGHTVTYELDKNDQLVIAKSETILLSNRQKFSYSLEKDIELQSETLIKHQITVEDRGNIYNGVYYFTGEQIEDLGKLTKGNFWYNYHTMDTQPILIEECALIETQLETYWQQAYIASKNCEYFLPESWKPSTDSNTNHFSSLVLTTGEENGAQKIFLSNKIIPDVKIEEPQSIEYNFKHINSSGDSSTSLYELNSHPFYKSIILFLGGELENFKLVKTGTKKNLYKGDYGLKWSDLLTNIAPSFGSFELFDGQYPMLFRTLNNRFKEQSFVKYHQLIKQKEEFWNNLYKKYPFILLEETFTPSDATTSEEMLQLAQYAFKDKIKPEAGYKINYINTSQLENYSMTELRVGDGILIDFLEMQNMTHLVNEDLSQFLFISDISYSLRNDSDMQLTVNSIKYQDKLIQRLVKLIK